MEDDTKYFFIALKQDGTPTGDIGFSCEDCKTMFFMPVGPYEVKHCNTVSVYDPNRKPATLKERLFGIPSLPSRKAWTPPARPPVTVISNDWDGNVEYEPLEGFIGGPAA